MTYLDNCERYWEPSGCYVELADGLLHIWIDGPYGERETVLNADEGNIAALDAGESPLDGWEDGAGNDVSYWTGHGPFPVAFRLGDNVCVAILDDSDEPGADLWELIDGYDNTNGTDLYDVIGDGDILAVGRLVHDEYPNAVPYDDVEVIDVSRRDRVGVLRSARNMDQWDGDGEDEDSWYAVQNGVTADGWPMTVRYAFPQGFEPEGDGDLEGHIEGIRILGTWSPQRAVQTEVSADMEVKATANSLVLKITREARMLGIDRGDIVNVTIRRKD